MTTNIEWANKAAERIEAKIAEGYTRAQARAEVLGTPASGSTITDSGLDDHTLAARSLANEFGVSELEARQSIGNQPHQVPIEAHADRIAKEDARVVAILQADADAEHAASPEGIKQAAEKTLIARQQMQRDVQLGRVALEEGGQLSAADIASLSPQEVLEASGLVRPDDPFYAGASDYAANKAAAAKDVV